MTVLVLDVSEILLLKKLLERLTSSEPTIIEKEFDHPRAKPIYSGAGYELFGHRKETKTVMVAFCLIIQGLAIAGSDYFQKMSSVLASKGRSRTILARTRSDLYESGTSELKAKKWSKRIRTEDGYWYLDTNQSTDRKVKILKEICRVLDLEYGKDVILFSKHA